MPGTMDGAMGNVVIHALSTTSVFEQKHIQLWCGRLVDLLTTINNASFQAKVKKKFPV